MAERGGRHTGSDYPTAPLNTMPGGPPRQVIMGLMALAGTLLLAVGLLIGLLVSRPGALQGTSTALVETVTAVALLRTTSGPTATPTPEPTATLEPTVDIQRTVQAVVAGTVTAGAQFTRAVQLVQTTQAAGLTRTAVLFTRTPTVTRTPTPTASPTVTPTHTASATPNPLLTVTATASLALVSLAATATATRPAPPTEPATPTPAPTLTATGNPTAPPTNQCVAVAGDSVAFGWAAFEIPATGYVETEMGPVSQHIEDAYRMSGIGNVVVYNLSVRAVGISSSNHEPFSQTDQYRQLMTARCKYTVIMPWVNDLSYEKKPGLEPASAARIHTDSLLKLTHEVVASNPNGIIVVVNYYQGQAADFALKTWGFGFTPENIEAFRLTIASAFDHTRLGLPNVLYFDPEPLFSGLGGAHIVGTTSKQQFDAQMPQIRIEEQKKFVDFYFSRNPNGKLKGDGVHLTDLGKDTLARALVGLMPLY